MPSSDPIRRLQDILDNISRIEEHTAGYRAASFLEDHKTYDAVERCLERISEASKKLGNVAEELCPDIPWPKLRALGNFLRHEYDRIDGERLWFVVERELAPLKAAVEQGLRRLNPKND